ncbi:MAG: DNA integrity scanning protein DisA [Actinobacteria bacterium]|nr:MAG: DNA integrity scanning protein DisA [Actinomycetota bacterium]
MPDKRKSRTLVGALEWIAPGTPLRQGLDHIISARTGALIVIGDVEHVLPLCDGGFHIDAPFTPQRLFELAKMDGAIILTENIDKVLLANVHLQPNPSLPTTETGMRHRTAERIAKQTDALVISVSQRRDVVSVYQDSEKWILSDIRVVLDKANQAIQTLQKYKDRLDQVSSNLSALEFEDLVTLLDVVNVVQRSAMVQQVASEIERFISELGTEGRLVRLQLDELMGNVVDDAVMVVRDYAAPKKRPREAIADLVSLSNEELLDLLQVAKALGYEGPIAILDMPLHPKGFRLLRRIPRLPVAVIERIVSRFGTLQNILHASTDDLDAVEGIGPKRAKAIKDGLTKLKEYNWLERFA